MALRKEPLTGNLYIAGPYDEKTVRRIAKHFEKMLGGPVTLAVKQDPRLIGGFRAMIDGRLYDASVATQADRMLCTLRGEDTP